jgi:two-component system chemotaxis sensor kinase CheA
MTNHYAAIEGHLNSIAARIPLLENSDLSPFALIINSLNAIPGIMELPPAFKAQIQRTVSLIENIILGAVDFGAGCRKLGQSCEKMIKATSALGGKKGEKNAEEFFPLEDEDTGNDNRVPDTGTTPTIAAPTIAGDPSLLADFITEASEHIHTAERVLLELEINPADEERINAVFRAWHTIKGVAGFLNLKEIQSFAHGMESAMDRVRRGESTLNAARIDVLLESNDCLKAFMKNVENTLSGGSFEIPDNYEALVDRLMELDAQPFPDDAATIACPEKKIGELLVEQGMVSRESVDESLKFQEQGDKRKIGEILIEDRAVPARAVAGALAAQTAGKSGSAIEETIRVPVSRIDQIVDIIGEAVIAQSMIYADKTIKAIDDQGINTKISHAAMIMRQMQEMAMSLRMVSVKATFQKMARLARDLSKKCGREIDFVTEGEETEIDKSVVEKIGDPLVHMVRNAVDHGIEPPEERVAAGKPQKATVRLRAYHRAGNMYIDVADDGRGLDRDAIFAKAVERGLCKADARLTDSEIFGFIFLPGLSTAKQVTDVSGRGVGMDVVRRNIEALRGSVEIMSTRGRGTTFSIRLPLTLAIVDGMIVAAGSEEYIIPTLAILESLKPGEHQIETVMGKGQVIKVRTDLIPLVNLASLFSGNRCAGAAAGREGVVMIVEDMLGKKIGLHLDEIIGQQQVVIKSLGEELGEIPGVTGGAIMNDGGVSLILDIGGIVKLAHGG